MNKAEFIQAIQMKAEGINKSTIEKVLDGAADVSLGLIQAGEVVPVIGLGNIKVVQRAARQGRNPRTGAVVNVPAKRAAKFTANKALKEALN